MLPRRGPSKTDMNELIDSGCYIINILDANVLVYGLCHVSLKGQARYLESTYGDDPKCAYERTMNGIDNSEELMNYLKTPESLRKPAIPLIVDFIAEEAEKAAFKMGSDRKSVGNYLRFMEDTKDARCMYIIVPFLYDDDVRRDCISRLPEKLRDCAMEHFGCSESMVSDVNLYWIATLLTDCEGMRVNIISRNHRLRSFIYDANRIMKGSSGRDQRSGPVYYLRPQDLLERMEIKGRRKK